jgi:hypothetical protein
VTGVDEASGHYRTAAGAVAFVGTVGLGMTGLALVTGADLRFIDPPALLGFSVLFLVVAAAMVARREG